MRLLSLAVLCWRGSATRYGTPQAPLLHAAGACSHVVRYQAQHKAIEIICEIIVLYPCPNARQFNSLTPPSPSPSSIECACYEFQCALVVFADQCPIYVNVKCRLWNQSMPVTRDLAEEIGISNLSVQLSAPIVLLTLYYESNMYFYTLC